LLEVEPSETDDAHPLRAKFNKAKAEIRKIIAQHQQTMDDYQSSISDNIAQTKDLQTKKERAVADYDRALKELADQKKKLWDAHNTTKTNKIKAEEDLALAIAEGTASINKLAKELKDSIAELTAERTQTQQQRAQLITTCEEERKSLLSSQGQVISAFKAEISQLKQQKTDAQQKLDALMADHGVEHLATTTTAAPESTGNKTLDKALDCSKLTGGEDCGVPIGDWKPQPGVKGCNPRLVLTKGTTCHDYCSGQGFECLRAQDNVHAKCVLDARHHRQDTADHGCKQKWNNQICECVFGS